MCSHSLTFVRLLIQDSVYISGPFDCHFVSSIDVFLVVFFAGIVEQLCHKFDVSYCQSQSFDSGQMFLVGECGDSFAQDVECGIEIAHSVPLSDVGGLPLSHSRYSTSGFLPSFRISVSCVGRGFRAPL